MKTKKEKITGEIVGKCVESVKFAVHESMIEKEQELLNDLRVSFSGYQPDSIEIAGWNETVDIKFSKILNETEFDFGSPDAIAGLLKLAKNLELVALKIRKEEVKLRKVYEANKTTI